VYDIAAARGLGKASTSRLAASAGIADGVHAAATHWVTGQSASWQQARAGAAASKELYSTKTTATIKARALRIPAF
jgi:hypothetical protein